MITIDEEIVSLRKSASKSLDYEWQREQYQLAEWLEELKDYRRFNGAKTFDNGFKQGEKYGYNKAIVRLLMNLAKD